MTAYKTTFDENMKRVDSLISVYDLLKRDGKTSDKNKEYKFTDMLRAAVVFMHSSFETYYRTIIIEELKENKGGDVLKDFPILTEEGKEKSKITVSDLIRYSGKTVQEVIGESIENKLGRTSFNSYSDIYEWAKKINIDLTEFKKQEDVEKAIQRRHRIVHEADTSKVSGKGKPSSIYPGMIHPWKEAYIDLVDIIDGKIILKGDE